MTEDPVTAITRKVVAALKADGGTHDPVQIKRRVEEALIVYQLEVEQELNNEIAHKRALANNEPE